MKSYVHGCLPISFMSVIISQRSYGIFNIEEFDKKQDEINRNVFLRQNHQERHSKDDRQENNLPYCSLPYLCGMMVERSFDTLDVLDIRIWVFLIVLAIISIDFECLKE